MRRLQNTDTRRNARTGGHGGLALRFGTVIVIVASLRLNRGFQLGYRLCCRCRRRCVIVIVVSSGLRLARCWCSCSCRCLRHRPRLGLCRRLARRIIVIVVSLAAVGFKAPGTSFGTIFQRRPSSFSTSAQPDDDPPVTVRFSMASHLRFIVHTTQRHADVLSTQSLRNRFSK